MRLPPLNALRAFEAAARHGGFIAAADELHVTRGAISRQVKLLEEHLGVALFQRQPRGVTLTREGRELLPVLTAAFKDIATGIDRLTAAPRADLRIICPPATSVRWLMPNIGSFRERYPQHSIQLTTDYYDRRGYDRTMFNLGISVEFWHDRRDDVNVQPLAPLVIGPACIPEIAARLKSPEDLANETLLHENIYHFDWKAWLSTFSVSGVDPSSGDVFHNLDIAVQSALLGRGVVLADLLLCQRELESGALVMPFPDMLCDTSHGRFALIGNRETWDDPAVADFRAWMAELTEIANTTIFAGTPYA